jgi:hypothetical protein
MTLTASAGITISAAPAAVFAWIVDPTRAAQWGDNLQYLPADHPAIAAGMQANVTLPPNDSPSGLTVKQCDSPTAFSYEITSPKQTITWSYALDDVTAGTVLTATASVDTTNTVTKAEDQIQGDTPLHHFLSWAMMEMAGNPLGPNVTSDFEEAAGPREQDLQLHLQSLIQRLTSLVEAAG